MGSEMCIRDRGKIERRKSGVCAAGLNPNIYGRHVWLGNIDIYERTSLVEVELAFRTETRTRRLVDLQRICGISDLQSTGSWFISDWHPLYCS